MILRLTISNYKNPTIYVILYSLLLLNRKYTGLKALTEEYIHIRITVCQYHLKILLSIKKCRLSQLKTIKKRLVSYEPTICYPTPPIITLKMLHLSSNQFSKYLECFTVYLELI